MKVIALVSGGKDSTFSMEVCRQYGHEIVALANLFPADPSTDELDSYMYQTVGHHVIATYAQCCALPLFRRRIQGASRDQTLVYRDTQGDEVEDLAALLAYIQQQMPAVQAVASGAIASDYQRTRVERVCARLGLVSLAYLWHQPQLPLLHRMIEAPIDAVLIKIAAAGLIPGKHLGASLPRMLPQLLLLRQRFGCNVCGEGGEYETLTLDCPAFVCGRIVLDSSDSILVDDNAMAPVAFLHPTAFHFEEKRSTNSVDQSDSTTNCSANLKAPPLRQGVVIQVPDEFCAPMSTDTTTANDDVLCSADPTALEPAHKAVIFHSFRGHRVATLTAAVDGAPAEDYVREADTRKALWEALCRIADALPEFHASWQDTLFVHLYLPNMRHFAAANAVYAQFFPAINPPARACVQLESTAGGPGVVVEVLVSIPPRDNAMSSAPTRRSSRKVLHVQSVSEWAPACIGPYAQALAFSGIVHFAGQIPLHPPTMEVISGDFLAQSNRCLQSCQAVGIAMRTDVPQSMLWCHVYVSTAGGLEAREAAAAALGAFLRGIHVDTPQVEDCCDKGCGESILEENESEDEDNREADNELDDYLKPPCLSPRQWEPLVTFIEVPQLPKGVAVEFQPTAWVRDAADESTSSSSSSDSDDGDHEIHMNGGPATFAARSSAPRWIQRLEHRQQVVEMLGWVLQMAWLASHASMACIHLFLTPAQTGDDKLAGSDAGTAIQHICQKLVVHATQVLTDNGMCIEDVASAKLYFGVESCERLCIKASGVRRGIAEHLGIEVPIVPVTAIGSDSTASAAIHLQLLARR